LALLRLKILDKISNKKIISKMMNLFWLYIENIERGHYIQVYVEKRMIRFKLMMLELKKHDITFTFCIFITYN